MQTCQVRRKYRPAVPKDYWEDELYLKPANKVLKKFKEEKVIRKEDNEGGLECKGSGGDGTKNKTHEHHPA